MKFASVVAVLCVAVALTDAFAMGRGRGGIGLGRGGLGFGRGLGLGFGGLGFGGLGWGLGGWGMGGLGLGGWGMGLGFPGVGFPGVGVPGIGVPGVGLGGIGMVKRAAETKKPTGLIVPQFENGTVCTYIEKNTTLTCMANTFNFECEVTPINMAAFSPIRAQNLTVVLDERVIDGIHFPVFRLFSRNGHALNSFSMTDKKDEDKKIVLSIFNNERLIKHETGIRVKDDRCWTDFVAMFSEVIPSTIDFDFVETGIPSV